MTNLVTFPGLGLSFEINRVAFSIGGIAIYWYGIMIAVGIMLAMVFAFRHCAEFGIDGDTMVDVIVVGVVMAIVCARIYYVAMSPIAYNSLWDVLDLRQGGIAIYGGVIGAIIFGGLACKWRKIPVLPMFDLTAMGFLIGQCLGRWGNFFNQEAFGCNKNAASTAILPCCTPSGTAWAGSGSRACGPTACCWCPLWGCGLPSWWRRWPWWAA